MAFLDETGLAELWSLIQAEDTALVEKYSLTNVMKMELVSYTGTGTKGSSNQNSVTFSFTPKVVLFVGELDTTTTTFAYFAAKGLTAIEWNKGTSFVAPGMTNSAANNVSFSGNTMSWYNTATNASGAQFQANVSGHTYYLLAIG